MTDFTQAADALKRMAVQYKNIVAVADALESLGSITQATDEARAALESARKERDDFAARYAQEMAACRDELAAMRAAADKAAQDVREQSEIQARAVLAGAEAKAAQIVGAAQAQAHAMTDRAIADKQSAQAQLQELEQAIKDSTQEHAELTKRVKDAQAQHDQLVKAIGKLKAAFAS